MKQACLFRLILMNGAQPNHTPWLYVESHHHGHRPRERISNRPSLHSRQYRPRLSYFRPSRPLPSHTRQFSSAAAVGLGLGLVTRGFPSSVSRCTSEHGVVEVFVGATCGAGTTSQSPWLVNSSRRDLFLLGWRFVFRFWCSASLHDTW